MELQNARLLCLSLMEQNGITDHGFTFKWSNGFCTFGFCKTGYTKRQILLSKKLVEVNDEDRVRQTILHEIAHALDYIRNGCQVRYKITRNLHKVRLAHDRVWQRICMEIGCSWDRCYSSANTVIPQKKQGQVKFELVHCETGEVFHSYTRQPSRQETSELYINKRKHETLGKLIIREVF